MLNSTSFRRVKPGEPVSAEQWNKLLEFVERLAGISMVGGHMLDGPGGPVFVPVNDPEIRFVELNEIDGIPHDQAADDLHVDPDIASGTDPWIDFGTDSNFIMPPYAGVWLTGERSMVMRHSGAGKHVLLPFTQWHIAVLENELFEGSTATASIWELQASGEGDSNRTVTVYPWALPENESISADKKVVVAQHRQSGRWYVVDWVREDVKEGVLDGSLSPATGAKTNPSTATLSVYEETASGVHDSGANITVTNRMTEIATVAAGTWMVVRRVNGEWRPIAADCGVTNLEGT